MGLGRSHPAVAIALSDMHNDVRVRLSHGHT